MSILEDALKIKQCVVEMDGLPGFAIDLLRGTTKEEIEEDAKRLARFMGFEIKPKDLSQNDPGGNEKPRTRIVEAASSLTEERG